MIITFCGHSDFQGSEELKQRMLQFLTHHVGDRQAVLYFGGYGAFDRFAHRCAQAYKVTHPNMKLILITPYLKVHKSDCGYDETIYPPLEHIPRRLAIIYRNQWMVRQADMIVAFVDHTWGGAYQVLCYARKQRKLIFDLAQGNMVQ